MNKKRKRKEIPPELWFHNGQIVLSHALVMEGEGLFVWDQIQAIRAGYTELMGTEFYPIALYSVPLNSYKFRLDL